MPIITMVLARIILGEDMSSGQLAGSALAFCGMIVVVVHGDPSALLRLDFNPSELWMVAAVLFAVYAEPSQAR
jgi:drug/metabolite transporter (DMT)-like permease